MRGSSVLAAAALAACGPDLRVLEVVDVEGRHDDLTAEAVVTFMVFGDAGTGFAEQYEVARAMSEVCRRRGCRFAISLGDNIYDHGVDGVDDPQFHSKFEAPYADFGDTDFWMSLGNHDWEGDAQAQVDYSRHSRRWLMPSGWYAVPGLPGWLNLFALDTTALTRNGDLAKKQKRAATAALCDRPGWRALFGHHAARSNGKHGDNTTMDAFVSDLADACGVQIFFAGHDHHQEELQGAGFLQIIQGAAARTRSVSPDARSTFASTELGAAVVEASATHLDIAFYDTGGAELHRSLWRLP